jgi:GDSL-like lipase/acylhydrolase family protein
MWLVRDGPARSFPILIGAAAWACGVPAQTRDPNPSGATEAPALDPTRFEPEIRAFEAGDRAHPPPLGGVVFVGSSSIKNWTNVAADFPGVPVLNRGFGGSTLGDVVYYADRIVFPYRPRLVVLYAGDNDLTLGRTPDRVLGDYRAFVRRVRSSYLRCASGSSRSSRVPRGEPTWVGHARRTG